MGKHPHLVVDKAVVEHYKHPAVDMVAQDIVVLNSVAVGNLLLQCPDKNLLVGRTDKLLLVGQTDKRGPLLDIPMVLLVVELKAMAWRIPWGAGHPQQPDMDFLLLLQVDMDFLLAVVPEL